MRSMKKEEINLKPKKRHSDDFKGKSISWGIIAAVLGVMIATVKKGMDLDKKEAADKAAETKDNQ